MQSAVEASISGKHFSGPVPDILRLPEGCRTSVRETFRRDPARMSGHRNDGDTQTVPVVGRSECGSVLRV